MKREIDDGHDSGKNQKKKGALVCCSCGRSGHPARLCPTPPVHATQAVDEKGDTDEESSEEGGVFGVEWECGLNGAGDEDDGILGRRWDSTAHSKWERLAAVVGLGSSRKKRFTGKRLQASGFVKLAKSESATMVRGSSRFACPTGMWREAHGKWQT